MHGQLRADVVDTDADAAIIERSRQSSAKSQQIRTIASTYWRICKPSVRWAAVLEVALPEDRSLAVFLGAAVHLCLTPRQGGATPLSANRPTSSTSDKNAIADGKHLRGSSCTRPSPFPRTAIPKSSSSPTPRDAHRIHTSSLSHTVTPRHTLSLNTLSSVAWTATVKLTSYPDLVK